MMIARMIHTLSRSARRGSLFMLLPLLTACSAGIRWRGFSFPPVLELAKSEHNLTFVYFRHWSVVACTNFEEHVLKDPRVRKAVDALCPVPLDFVLDHSLAKQWGIESVPGVVILDTQGRVVSTLIGSITADELLNAIEAAKLQAESPEAAP